MSFKKEMWTRALNPKSLLPIENLWVSDEGNVKREAYIKILKSGHRRYYNEWIGKKTITNQGYIKSIGHQIHRLVFASFKKEKVGKGFVVHHKNNNRQDNKLSNLEKVTYSVNALSKNRIGTPKSTAKKWRGRLPINPIKGELWKVVPDRENYQVSNLGRVQNSKENALMRLTDTNGYLGVDLSKYRKYLKYSVHRLVWEVFMGTIPDGHVIHHINHDKKDNRLKNLSCETYSKNTRLAIESDVLKIHGKSQNDRKLLDQYLLKGYTVDEIARDLNYARASILKRKRDIGLSKTRYNDFTGVHHAIELLKQGKSYRDVSAKMGFTVDYLRKLKFKNGLTKSLLVSPEKLYKIDDALRNGPKNESMARIGKRFGVSKTFVQELNRERSIRTKRVGWRLEVPS